MPDTVPLPILDPITCIGVCMPPKMVWLVTVIRLAIAPVFLGALFLWVQPHRSGRDVAAAAGLA